MKDPEIPHIWQHDAACQGANIEVFYPKIAGGVNAINRWKQSTAEARSAYCDACPVHEICLNTAIDERDFEGIRAGLSPRQMRAELRNRLKAGIVKPRNIGSLVRSERITATKLAEQQER